MYIQQKHLNDIDWVMLEIRIPRDIEKSLVALEMVLANLLQGGGIGNKYARFFQGGMPVYSSLEIASLEGIIHFYIRIQKKFRPMMEASFYSQFPGIEIVETEDYTSMLQYHHLSKDVSMFGATFRTSKTWKPRKEDGEFYKKDDKDLTMPADFYPIKTYDDYGPDLKVDPLSILLEIMGSLRKGEYFWYQILVQDEGVYNDKKLPKFYVHPETHKHMSLVEMAEEEKKQVRTTVIKKGTVAEDDYGEVKRKEIGKDEDGKPILTDVTYTKHKTVAKKDQDLTSEEKAKLESIEKKLSKPLALVVMRAIYITKKENFNPAHINDLLSFTKPFKGVNDFGLTPSNPYNFPWQDMGKKRSNWRAEELFEEYVEREGFFPHIKERESLQQWEDMFFWTSSMKTRKLFRMIYEAIFFPFDHPHAEQAFTLNLEELATLWHLPNATTATPTIPRIDSTKGMAPTNLPV